MLTKKINRRGIGMKVAAIGLVLLGLLMLTDMRLRPIIQKAGAYRCQVAVSRIIDDAVSDGITLYEYSDLIRIVRDGEGGIASIESDMANINLLKAKATQLINDGLLTIAESEVYIPLGTVLGIDALYGRGPAIPVKLSPMGFANVNLVSDFSSAGINQTLHRIILTVSAEVSAVIPGYTTSVPVQTEFIIAETVIVGKIPESYTHIIV